MIWIKSNFRKTIFCFLALISTNAYPQSQNYSFSNFTVKNGLSSNAINTVAKDNYGFMWFGTEDGLNKFDGQNFTIYRHKEKDPNSIGRGAIMAIQKDNRGNIWVGSNTTLSRYSYKNNNFKNFDFTNLGWIRSLLADSKGNIWIGTYTGLYLLDPVTNKQIAFLAQPSIPTKLNSDVILCLHEDKKGQIWVGTNNGLHLLDPKTKLFKRFFNKPSDLNSLSDNIVRTITEDKKGQIWIGTDTGGINVYNPSKNVFSRFLNTSIPNNSLISNRINKLIFDKNETLWIGTDLGLNTFDTQLNKTSLVKQSPTISNDEILGDFKGSNIRDIFIDTGGIYWFATLHNGINKYDNNLAYFNHIKTKPNDNNSLFSNSILCFSENTANEILFGTYVGLGVFNPQTKISYKIPLKTRNGASNAISTLYKLGENTYVGTFQNGIYVLNKEKNIINKIEIADILNPKNNIPINAINSDKLGNIWIGTNGMGLYKYIPSTKQLQKLENKFYKNSYISAIVKDKIGNMWIGSNGAGIAVYYANSSKIEIFNQSNSHLAVDKVLDIFCSSSNQIWAGVLGGGLCKFNSKTKTFRNYGESENLSNDVVYEILEDQQNKLWISTNKGISSFDVKNEIFKNYSYRNGIQQDAFFSNAGLNDSNGILYFGGHDGFNYFDPNKLLVNKNTPNLAILDIKINNKSYSTEDDVFSNLEKIEIKYGQNISIAFAALNFTAPEENQYKYKLDGFDTDWIDSGHANNAVYTNLDPGSYTLRIKATSEDGAWKSKEKLLFLKVDPPFYRTNLAYFIYLTSLITILWISRSRTLKKLKTEFSLQQERLQVKHLIETERIESEKKVEIEKLKIKFLTNLSHELKTPLALVINPVEKLISSEKNTEKSETLKLVDRNSKRLLNLVNQLLDLKKIEENELKLLLIEDDLVKVLKEIIESFKYISDRKKIELDFDTDLKAYLGSFDKEKIERILFNLLSNAIKFTNENGNVFIQLEKVYNKGINISIRDTGIGLDSDSKDRIFERFYKSKSNQSILNQGSGIGLSITQEFVKLHGGTIEVDSELGVGTEFKVFLPILPKKITLENLNATTQNILENPKTIDLHDSKLNTVEQPCVLIIDDSEDFRTYLKESLSDKYKIIEAEDGKAGWQKTLSGHPDIIVSDVNMPKFDGLSLSKKIKNDPRTSHIPIILLTVNNDEQQELIGLNSGATDYITKPFSFNILNSKIENLLNLNTQFKNTYSKKISFEPNNTQALLTENEKFIEKIIKIVEDNIGDPEITITELSKKMFMSRGTLYNKIHQISGEPPVEFIRTIKLKKAAHLIENTDLKISQIAYEVGFSNPNYFARAFKTKYSISPTEFRIRKSKK